MTRRTYGFGIIGTGVIAPIHAAAIADLPDARLVAVADQNRERARALAGELGVEDDDPDGILTRPDIDVVCVCVPSGRHAEVGARVAAAGKHVVVEKPIEVSLEAADRLIATARENGVKVAVISQHRWDPGVRELKDLADGGQLGRLILGDAIVKWYRTQQYYDSGAWRGSWELDGGGALMNQAVHYVDLLQWIMGPVDRVFARTRAAAHERIEVEDIAVAVLTFTTGAVGVLEASTAVYPGLAERLEVTGTAGTVIVEAGEIALCKLKGERGETGAYGEPAVTRDRPRAAAVPSDISFRGHREQLRDLLDAIENHREPMVDGREGRKALEIILAAYESARTGREVELARAELL